MSKDGEVDQFLKEKLVHHHPRRLADWINPTGAKKVHSVVDKVYKMKNLELAWDKVRENRGAGGMDGESILKAGCWAEGEVLPTDEGTPQGGVISPILSNILLTPFDWEMRKKGYRLTRYADDWLVTCTSRSEARAALTAAQRILEKLGVTLHAEKTRIVHVRQGFEFLGFKIKRGKPSSLKLPPEKIWSGVVPGSLYAYPREKSVQHFKEQIRKLTRRKAPVKTQRLIDQINPVIRGWGNYYCKAHVRLLFYRLNTWIVRRIWSHKCKRWRNMGWKKLPDARLYGEMGLVNLIALIPSLAAARKG